MVTITLRRKERPPSRQANAGWISSSWWALRNKEKPAPITSATTALIRSDFHIHDPIWLMLFLQFPDGEGRNPLSIAPECYNKSVPTPYSMETGTARRPLKTRQAAWANALARLLVK